MARPVAALMWGLLALYGATLATLHWLRQGNLSALLTSSVMAGYAAWSLWSYRLRGGPPPEHRGLLWTVLVTSLLSLLLTYLGMRAT